MKVIIVSLIVSLIVNILMYKKSISRARAMLQVSLDKTLKMVEKEYTNLHENQIEGSPRYWYTKGCKDSATDIKDLLVKRPENKLRDMDLNDNYENVGIGVPVPEPGKVKPPLKKN